jgi:hypothetical protein
VIHIALAPSTGQQRRPDRPPPPHCPRSPLAGPSRPPPGSPPPSHQMPSGSSSHASRRSYSPASLPPSGRHYPQPTLPLVLPIGSVQDLPSDLEVDVYVPSQPWSPPVVSLEETFRLARLEPLPVFDPNSPAVESAENPSTPVVSRRRRGNPNRPRKTEQKLV